MLHIISGNRVHIHRQSTSWKFEIVLERYKFISLKSVSCLQCQWHLTMNGTWPCQLSHVYWLHNRIGLGLYLIIYIFTSAHQIKPWSWAKFEEEIGKNNLALSQTCWWRVHPKTEVQKSKIKHVDQHFFFFFHTNERDIWCGFIYSRQVMTINNIICIREGSSKIIIIGIIHLLKCYHWNC